MPEEIKDEFVEEVPLVKEEEQVSLNQIAPNTPLEPDSEKKDLKTIFLVIAVTLGLIILVVGGFKLGDKLTGANVADVIDVDALHQLNAQGKLEETRGYIYNGRSFVYADGLWWTKLNILGEIKEVRLHYGPKEVEDITFIGELDEAGFNQRPEIYMAIDPNISNKYYSVALNELNSNIVQGMGRPIITSCTEEAEICENRTIISCENNQGLPVIQLAIANETSVKFKDTCIFIEGDGYDLIKAAEKAIWTWYGVFKQ